jgi:outer membrane protein OmpA-like peptidoglycan-associated protein
MGPEFGGFFLPKPGGIGHLRGMSDRHLIPSFSNSLFAVFLIGTLMVHAGPVGAHGNDESKKRLRAAEKEIEHLRDNLHEAQRELASKSERIEDLEKELIAAKAGGKNSEASRKREKEKRPALVAEPEKKRRVPDPPKPSPALKQKPAVFELDYEAKSAVNYDGREKALAWMEQQLAANPSGSFEVIGWANDSPYAEVNVTIATNRAKYLADYLTLSGIPKDRIVLVTAGEGEGGRRARITALPGAPSKDGGKGREKG